MNGYCEAHREETAEGWPLPLYIPEPDRHCIPADPLLNVLRRLTSLRNLHLPISIRGPRNTSVLTNPVVPYLDQLTIMQPTGQEDVSSELFLKFIGLFGSVRHLVLYNIHLFKPAAMDPEGQVDAVAELPAAEDLDDGLPSADLSRFSLKSFRITHDQHIHNLHGPQPMSTVMNLISKLPAVHLLTALDLCYIYPTNMPALCDLIRRTSPQLEDLSLQLEHRSIHHCEPLHIAFIQNIGSLT